MGDAMLNGMGTEKQVDVIDSRVSLIESKLVNLTDALDHRIDSIANAIGAPPNPALGLPGRGLVGSVALLLEAEQERKREEREREKRMEMWERRKGWATAVISATAAVLASLYYWTMLHK